MVVKIEDIFLVYAGYKVVQLKLKSEERERHQPI